MILLDTHVWVWWVQGDDRLAPAVVAALDGMSEASVAVSAISFWEVALLARHRRLALPDPPEVWLRNAVTDPRLAVLPVTHDVATHAALLPELHKDPADRILIAHAMLDAHPLVTEDAHILAYEGLRAIRTAALHTIL